MGSMDGYGDNDYDDGNYNSMSLVQQSLSRAKMYEKLAIEAHMAAERIASYGDDVYWEGAVLVWDMKFPRSEKIYQYAAIKANGSWYVTGPQAPKGFTWEELVDWLMRGEQPNGLSVVTETNKVPS